ncbi:baseplate J/gp47 family protein [Paludibacteraceae bacterium OttesenSCG-928-F17]|nr:baseplate J/gp47 family protein [Paludibacteraceae bacterium OttesenSCG-928-F17]
MNTTPEFITRNPADIMAECKNYLEERLGREIQPAQIEQLILNTIVYRETLLLNRFNAGLANMLYQFSSGTTLDYIAGLVAVERLPEAKAGCTVRFTLVDGHGIILIPTGTRVASSDGIAIFETTEDIIVLTNGGNNVEAYVIAQTTGASHNGYAPGTINKILDPYAFISSVANIDTTGGGSDAETDEQLRQRIKLAPSQFSVAGPRESYMYLAKSANASIKDISVTSPLPGTVLIVPLTDSGEISQTVIEDIYNACSADKVRPLTDTVIVTAPERIDYEIEVDITIYENVEAASVKKTIEDTLNDYATTKRKTLGQDIIKTHISQLCRLNMVYDVEVKKPANNLIVEDNEFTFCTGIIVNIIGSNRG